MNISSDSQQGVSHSSLTADINAPSTSTSAQSNVGIRNDNHGPSTAVASMQRPAGTVTMTEEPASRINDNPTVLRLTLAAGPTVRWDESTVDNEGLGRKSSKRCCIFHKHRDFGESSTDSSDESVGAQSDGEDNDKKPAASVARPRKGKKVPDFQRFHA